MPACEPAVHVQSWFIEWAIPGLGLFCEVRPFDAFVWSLATQAPSLVGPTGQAAAG